MSPQQQAVDQIVGLVKGQVMEAMNSLADEFDQMELTDEQRMVYNKVIEQLGHKVLAIRIQAV